MVVARGLGRGLGTLLGSRYGDDENRQGSVTMLHVNAVQPNAHQPRRDFTQESLEELAQSIRAQGVLQPILVRVSKKGDKYELIAGERRWRATRLAGLEEIPAIIREVSDQECLELALIENVQREDLNAIEQATALQQLLSHFQTTQQDLAQRTGVSRSHIANLLRLLQLPDSIQEDIRNQRCSPGHGRVLAGITDPDSRGLLRDRILEEGLSVRACEALAAQWRKTGVFPFQKSSDKKDKAVQGDTTLEAYARQVHVLLGVQRVRLRGTRERGSMTISYGSPAEFRQIMSKLGISETGHEA